MSTEIVLKRPSVRCADHPRTFEDALKKVAMLDLTMIRQKIMDPEEGKGWSKEHTDVVEERYRRFLCMLYVYPNESIVPATDIDAFWHQHILDTRAYASDCDEVFGEFVHHFPYFGMRGENDAQDLTDSFERTRSLYAEAFGEDYVVSGASKCGCNKCGRGPTQCHHPRGNKLTS